VDDVEGTVKNALKLFDHDGGSMVTVSELSTVLSRLGDKMSKDDIDEIFRQAEVGAEAGHGEPPFPSLFAPAGASV
jgi:Ca2+-binding EF-hand superfamily protein